MARARCVVAEAEIALVSRDLGWPAKALDAARATLEAARRPGERRACALSRGPAPAADRAPRRGASVRSPSSIPRPSRPRRGPPTNWWLRGSRCGACGPRRRALRSPGPRHAARAGGYPGADGGGRKRIPRPEHARGAPDRAWRRSGSSCSRKSKRCWRRRRSSWTRAVMSCVTRARWFRSQGVRCCSRSHARWAKRGPETCRGTRSSRGHSERSSPMNRIARGCESKSGGFARCCGRWPASARRSEGLRWCRAAHARSSCWRRPSKSEHAAVLAFLADGESWSSSALALALGASQRTVQRALDSLAAAGKVQSFGRGRARRWMTPPVPGFTTTLLLPAPLPSD